MGRRAAGPAVGCSWRARCRCCRGDGVRPAGQDGGTSTVVAPQRPCSERPFGTAGADADPPADLLPAAAAALGGGHEGGMEGSPAVEGDPVPVGVLAAGRPLQHLQRSCRAPARPWDAAPPPALPPSPVSGGLLGVTPGEHSQLCPAWARHAVCRAGVQHVALGVPCRGCRGCLWLWQPHGLSQAGTWALVSPSTDRMGPSKVCGWMGRTARIAGGQLYSPSSSRYR